MANVTARPATPDDLPDPLKPGGPELTRAPDSVPGDLDFNSPDSPSSPAYARSMAAQTVTALGTLCGGIQYNAGTIQRLEQEIAALEQRLKQLEWNKPAILADFSRQQIGAGACSDQTWTEQLPWPDGGTTSVVKIGADAVTARDTQNASGEIVGVLNTKFEYIELEGHGGIRPYDKGTWTININSADHVEFAALSDAQEFKKLLECKLAAQHVEARLPNQEEIDAKERELEAPIANLRNKIAALRKQLAQLEDENTESISQIRQGIRLWLAAVTFEETLIIRASAAVFRAARDEIKKIEARLADIRYQETRAKDPDKLAQLKKDEALWQSLLKQQRDRQQQAQQRVKQAILRAREVKLTEYRQISGCPGTVNTRWLFPQDEMHYRPVSFREPDFNLGIEFKFGRLKSRAAPGAAWPYSLPEVKQFIARFQATEPAASLSEATGASLSEGNLSDDETLLLQSGIPTHEPAPPPRRGNEALPLP
jgi:hypothetical protein